MNLKQHKALCRGVILAKYNTDRLIEALAFTGFPVPLIDEFTHSTDISAIEKVWEKFWELLPVWRNPIVPMHDRKKVEEWVKLLRSGTYDQGTNVLRNGYNEFCCLGVLCDLHSKETGTGWTSCTYTNYYFENSTILPKVVCDWFGLKTENEYKCLESFLADLNDSGCTFNEISDIIEYIYDLGNKNESRN